MIKYPVAYYLKKGYSKEQGIKPIYSSEYLTKLLSNVRILELPCTPDGPNINFDTNCLP